jgi:1,2-diacylglycerol 3-beta-galactosyltransferase
VDGRPLGSGYRLGMRELQTQSTSSAPPAFKPSENGLAKERRMNELLPERRHILFLFSDTGGGHRSAAEAIIEALEKDFGDEVTTKMVDIFQDYAPPPFHRAQQIYSTVVRVPQAWGLGYRLSNGHRRAYLLTSSLWPYVRKSARQLVNQNPSDLIVSVHLLANAPVLSALGSSRPPFVTVVTDLVTTHALWYHRRTDLCLVPTRQAFLKALENGLDPKRVKVVGLPVAEKFCEPLCDPQELRRQLGWPLDRPVILLVGGGDGMGPIDKTAHAIDDSRLPVTLVIIAGRNRALKASLDTKTWSLPVFIYGFVREMPQFMQAADILVTKAGPGTITEAFNAGLPLILYSRLPGQEDGNVSYVVSEGAGVWAPSADLIVSALRSWIENPEKRKQAADVSHSLARPQAARDIAQILVDQIRIKVRQ